ncbi:hypothetical protein BKA59DRAFT_534536 [Fusarium tricinctum]|uniref:Clr5 domain-containing protein n=1 Tax=Fusarium tricinctum TaxID=61284 RepID=A0A8K0W624_9HYPO|nr:hypothetical protein BKA59DRAFT_534536 [Fusarium tricinctum]
MASSKLTWVYGRTHRAKDVSNEAIDKYKSIIRQLYLSQNMTRDEVLSHLQEAHGFIISANQLTKATKRWGFYKQPRQARTMAQAPEASIEQEPEPMDAIFDIEVDALDTIDETEAWFPSGDGFIPSDILEHIEDELSSPGGHSRDQRHLSNNKHLDPHPLTNSELFNEYNNEKLSADYLECCFFFKRSFFSTQRMFKTIHSIDVTHREKIHRLLNFMRVTKALKRHAAGTIRGHVHLLEAAVGKMDETILLPDTPLQHRMLFHCYLSCICCTSKSCQDETLRHVGRFEQIKDELLASPKSSLDIWSIYCLWVHSTEQNALDDLLDRLDIDDELFLYFFERCLDRCKQWLELVDKGLPTRFELDSLFLHAEKATNSQEVCRLIQKENKLDTWEEAGFLFAFVWGNVLQEAEGLWSSIESLRSGIESSEISGISPTHFLAVVCRMIVYQTINFHPTFQDGFARKDATKNTTKRFISRLYQDTIESFKMRQLSPREIKRQFFEHFIEHHTWPDQEPEDDRSTKRFHKYQRTALRRVIEFRKAAAKYHTPVQETPQVAPLPKDVQMTNSGSLDSSKSANFDSQSTSSSHARQLHLSALSRNPTMTRSPASGSSRGSSFNSFRRFQAASAAITIRLKERQGSHMQSLDEQVNMGKVAGKVKL